MVHRGVRKLDKAFFYDFFLFVLAAIQWYTGVSRNWTRPSFMIFFVCIGSHSMVHRGVQKLGKACLVTGQGIKVVKLSIFAIIP